MPTQYTIYFAGELFDHKHLAGNALLASHIEAVSDGRYRCILPQNLEQTDARAVSIRNQDLLTVMGCDLALFNFDGTELDSGTVVEYMYAKLLDIPAVILRSDFRHAGDQDKDGEPWNLMASFYPRTRVLHLDGMRWYQEEFERGGSAEQVSARFHQRIAAAVIELLDAVRGDAPILRGGQGSPDDVRGDAPVLQGGQGSPDAVERMYRWALDFPAGGLSEHAAAAGLYLPDLIASKTAKGLI